MKKFKYGLSGVLCAALVFASVALAHDHDHRAGYGKSDPGHGSPLAEAARDATRAFRNVQLAGSAGYLSMGACVSSGGDEGAMGVHYVNVGDLFDGVSDLDVATPEALMYEQRNGKLRLLGVEYILLAKEWDDAHPKGEAPALMGQLFDYVGAPNRYRLDPVYILHVWAWKDNPNGTFSNWNPTVSCDEYTGGMAD